MGTVRMVAIPEADADLLLKGLRNQASGGYSAPWIELCDRMVRLLEGNVVWQGKPVTETGPTPLVLYPELVDALKRARTKVNREWTQAHEQSRIALSGAAYALDYLARELTPERDGAGALPVQPPEPVAATSTPAPSQPVCGSRHAKFDLTCTLVPNHAATLDHYNAEHGVWWK